MAKEGKIKNCFKQKHEEEKRMCERVYLMKKKRKKRRRVRREEANERKRSFEGAGCGVVCVVRHAGT
jgi:hypothetical protein